MAEPRTLLDINIDGGSSQHFDSGLITGGSGFPSVSISVSRGTFCYKVSIDIKASPQKNDSFVAVLENPTEGQKVSGILPIYGWALDLKGITQISSLMINSLEIFLMVGYGQISRMPTPITRMQRIQDLQ